MRHMKSCLCGLVLLLGAASRGGETAYEESFAAGAMPLENADGWKVRALPSLSEYAIGDGYLTVRCHTTPDLRGGFAEREIPLCPKGMFEFDLKIDHTQKGIGLFMELYNITLFWHDYCEDWRRYFPEPVSKRMKNFNVEPVGHRRIAGITKKDWHHYRVVFDKDADRVEYYVDNMDDPAYIDSGVPVWGRSEYQGGMLRLGNWGVTPDTMAFRLKNFKLTPFDTSATKDAPCDLVLLFNGLSFGRYGIKDALLANGEKADSIREYTLVNPRPALVPENTFLSDKLPASQTIARAKKIVLIDFPFCPQGVLPECVFDDIAGNVRKGSRLVVFGGLCSLGKGGYAESRLADILPVKIGSPWEQKKFAAPAAISAEGNTLFNLAVGKDAPAVLYRHGLELRKEAYVLLRADGEPLLVEWKVGEGTVAVFLGMTCGPAAEYPSLFWKCPGWQILAAQIVGVISSASGRSSP